MEASEEVAANVVKGRRTKRSRVQSPLPHGLTANSSSGDGGASWSPTSSINEFQDSTEEEEDMANCLILLAKGHSRDFPKQQQHRQDYDSRGGGVYTTKFNSRKFLETANSTGFWQGGHRASHKKPKATHNDERKKNLSPSSDEEDGGHYNNVSPLCLQLSDNNTNRGTYSNHNKGKIHECSVCGAEFTSGQALGGHMRRHRGPLLSSTATLSLTPLAIESEKPKKARNALSLDLDLNLPAPEDEKSSFASKQQQQHHQQPQQNTPLVFSSPALVGCHY
ncbi:ZINC FINGER PROTEIN ZAT5 [Salix viminalis]|uniref:ZINC FINGER PROTEIN ZAT5 n=1 Tax=Salix viminalis TaxID=40686 RepID=A0A9Q0Z3Q7_SALVM|nr:ZINC FINGER PROTEIN ZAT5 [Salix viminalis]